MIAYCPSIKSDVLIHFYCNQFVTWISNRFDLTKPPTLLAFNETWPDWANVIITFPFASVACPFTWAPWIRVKKNPSMTEKVTGWLTLAVVGPCSFKNMGLVESSVKAKTTWSPPLISLWQPVIIPCSRKSTAPVQMVLPPENSPAMVPIMKSLKTSSQSLRYRWSPIAHHSCCPVRLTRQT